MASFLRARNLTCFYCGRRTSTRYDGKTRQFECPNCDATNYLDGKGEITDPPVAVTEASRSTPKFAVHKLRSSQSSQSSDGIFCGRCVQNQRLFTAALAQWLPDDPNASDFAERERSMYSFRNRMERLYPQICADCEPKVRRRIEEATYTAKTDLLRRMIERSNVNRRMRARTWLDLFNTVGSWLWLGGLVLQLLWHASVLHSAGARMTDAIGHPKVTTLVKASNRLINHLPPPRSLLAWSTATAVLGAWWNPQLARSVRGFTRHITGFSKWYTYQAMIILMRGLLLTTTELSTPDPALFQMQLGAHCLIVSITALIHVSAKSSLQIDTSPLFGPSRQPRLHVEPATRTDQDDENKNMGQILDEIMESPCRGSRPPASPPPQWARHNNGGNPGSSLARGIGSSYPATYRKSLAMSSPASFRCDEDEEMDWQPTQSQYRAFCSSSSDRQTTRFGGAPVEPKKGPFWYKVPPAPTTPAQRMFNPPNQPCLRPRPENPPAFFRGPDSSRPGANLARPDEDNSSRPVIFAEPSFFPPPPKNDPRNTLSDMFSASFTLDQEGIAKTEEEGSSWLGRLVYGKNK